MTTTAPVHNFLRVVSDYYMPGREEMEPGTNALVGGAKTAPAEATAQQPGAVAESNFFGPDGLTFGDLLDVLNPLQHLPVIGDLYRSMTGDEISAGARISGGTLYGGPLGFLSALANTVIEEATGKDIGGNLLAQITGGDAADSVVLATVDAGDRIGDGVGDQVAAKLAEAAPARDGILPAVSGMPLVATGRHAAAMPAYPSLVASGAPNRQSSAPSTAGNVPEMSTAAFQTLLGSMNVAAPVPARQGFTAGGELPPVHKGTIREAGMEINRLLRAHAQGGDPGRNAGSDHGFVQ